jgi:hypothetical protein
VAQSSSRLPPDLKVVGSNACHCVHKSFGLNTYVHTYVHLLRTVYVEQARSLNQRTHLSTHTPQIWKRLSIVKHSTCAVRVRSNVCTRAHTTCNFTSTSLQVKFYKFYLINFTMQFHKYKSTSEILQVLLVQFYNTTLQVQFFKLCSLNHRANACSCLCTCHLPNLQCC